MKPSKEQPIEHFDWQRDSPLALPSVENWRFASLGAMLHSDDPEEDSRPLLIGADHNGPLELGLTALRRVAARASRWCQEHGIQVGDSLLLVRLPYSSEVPLAAGAIALMSLGMRVVLPMSFDKATLAAIATATNCRAMLWCAGEVVSTTNTQVREVDALFRAVANDNSMSTLSLDGPQAWHLPTASGEEETGSDVEFCQDEREVLVLSTSGSTGRPKLVRYTNQALLRVAEAWQVAGLMSETLTGGRSICPALSHSMGLRNVLHAVWNRQPTLLVQTEWMEEKTKKFVKLLERCRPEHITCGPALLNDLGLLSSNVQRVRGALGSLRCVVSSGAVEATRKYHLAEGIRLANAFGMTETQQVMNTLVGPTSAVRGALGQPLPGVSVAVRFTDSSRMIGRLFVSVPFGASGYVNAPDFGKWFETGDLVRVDGEDVVWIGRGVEDFLSTGQGVKVSLIELRENYEQLQQAVEALLYVDLSCRNGIGAVAYLGQRDPSDQEVQNQLLQAIEVDHKQMASKQRDFALQYMAISAIGCVDGLPPKRGPGKLNREQAMLEQTDLLAAMNDPATNDPRVVVVPQYGSDRPDWRRFAAPGANRTNS